MQAGFIKVDILSVQKSRIEVSRIAACLKLESSRTPACLVQGPSHCQTHNIDSDQGQGQGGVKFEELLRGSSFAT